MLTVLMLDQVKVTGIYDVTTVYCFLFAVKKFHVFHGLLGSRKTFCDCVHVNTVEAVNHESFSGNESKNI